MKYLLFQNGSNLSKIIDGNFILQIIVQSFTVSY